MAIESSFGELPATWTITTLGDICQRGGGFIQTGPFGSQLHAADYVQTGIPTIMPQNIGENKVVEAGISRITVQDAERLSKYRLQVGDIVYSRRGDVTRRALILEEQNGWLCGTGSLMVRLGKGIVDPKYVSYFLGDPSTREWIQRHAVGATMPNLNTSIMAAVPFVYPPLPEQCAIANVLGALDDKIELNRRMNRTLESMARAAFRQWFVESGEVESWERGKLGDVITNFDSKRVPVANRERAQRQGKYPYYGAASVMDYVDDYLFDGIYVLMGEDGSVVDDEGHPVIQYVWGKIWVNNHAHVLQGANGICNEHLYLFLKDVNILPYVTGAVQPKINQANMNSIPFPLPPMELREKFKEFVSPLFAKIRANDEESRTLASLRDALLPKLMRGEVKVSLTDSKTD